MGWCTAALSKQYVYRLHASLAVTISKIALSYWQSYSAGNTAASQEHVHDRHTIGEEWGNSLPVVLNKCRNSLLKMKLCLFPVLYDNVSSSLPTVNTCCSEPLCSVHVVLSAFTFLHVHVCDFNWIKRMYSFMCCCVQRCFLSLAHSALLVNSSCLGCFYMGQSNLDWAEIEWC